MVIEAMLSGSSARRVYRPACFEPQLGMKCCNRSSPCRSSFVERDVVEVVVDVLGCNALNRHSGSIFNRTANSNLQQMAIGVLVIELLLVLRALFKSVSSSCCSNSLSRFLSKLTSSSFRSNALMPSRSARRLDPFTLVNRLKSVSNSICFDSFSSKQSFSVPRCCFEPCMWKPILSVRFCFELRSSKLNSVEFLSNCLSSISLSVSRLAARRRSSHLSYSLSLFLSLVVSCRSLFLSLSVCCLISVPRRVLVFGRIVVACP